MWTRAMRPVQDLLLRRTLVVRRHPSCSTPAISPSTITTLGASTARSAAAATNSPRWTPPNLRHLIAHLLDPKPATRITVDNILGDPWFAGGCDSDYLSALMRPPGDKHHYWGLPGGELNAFGLVSFASGLDLSGLFMEAAIHRDWFVSADPAGRILDRVEEVAVEEGMLVRREGEKALGAVVESRDGDSMVTVEVCHLAAGGAVVEVHGGAMARVFWREKLGSVLCVSGPSRVVNWAESFSALNYMI